MTQIVQAFVCEICSGAISPEDKRCSFCGHYLKVTTAKTSGLARVDRNAPEAAAVVVGNLVELLSTKMLELGAEPELEVARSVSVRYFQMEIENHVHRDDIIRIATLVVEKENNRRTGSVKEMDVKG